MEFELTELRQAGIQCRVVSRNPFQVELDWPLDDNTKLKLRADYPDTYPHDRIQVQLLEGLDNVPTRHFEPLGKNICLIGRDSRQWVPSLTLYRLLRDQLKDAVRGTGVEDPQAEPAEFWWNVYERDVGSFCLIDTEWDLGANGSGTLELRYEIEAVSLARFGNANVPKFRSYVSRIFNSERELIASWSEPLGTSFSSLKKAIEIPWARIDTPLVPKRNIWELIEGLFKEHPQLNRRAQNLHTGVHAQVFAVAYPSELAHGEEGLAWTIFVPFGGKHAFGNDRNRKGTTKHFTVVPTFRAGRTDLGYRVPSTNILESTSAIVVGVGAIGSVLCTELARNRCQNLVLVDNDRVEPGNSVRWVLGAPVWGIEKTEALANFIASNYPACNTKSLALQIGRPRASDEESHLDGLLTCIDRSDLIIDASASYSVQSYLSSQARRRGKGLISVFATASVDGGAVCYFSPSGACPVCLEHHWNDGAIPRPGSEIDDDDVLVQPPGCAERTFSGASFDLSELSMQAVRLVVGLDERRASAPSIVQQLSFVNNELGILEPTWQTFTIETHPSCCKKT